MEKKYICTYDNGRYFVGGKTCGSFTFWSNEMQSKDDVIESARAAYRKIYGKGLHSENILKIEECYEFVDSNIDNLI